MNKKILGKWVCIWVLAILFFFQTGSISYARDTMEKKIEKRKGDVLQIVVVYTNKYGIEYPVQGGSGFLVSDNQSSARYVVTAKEVTTVSEKNRKAVREQFHLSDEELSFEVKVVAGRGEMISAEPVVESEAWDFSILMLSQKIYDKKPFTIAEAHISGSEQCAAAMGFMVTPGLDRKNLYYDVDDVLIQYGNFNNTLLFGRVGTSTEDGIQYLVNNITPTFGMLGGPIVNEEGNVIAICQSKEKDGRHWSLTMTELIPVLKAMGVPYTVSDELQYNTEEKRRNELGLLLWWSFKFDRREYDDESYQKMDAWQTKAANLYWGGSRPTQEEVDQLSEEFSEVVSQMKKRPPRWRKPVAVLILLGFSLVVWKITKDFWKRKRQKRKEAYTVSEPAPVFEPDKAGEDAVSRSVTDNLPPFVTSTPERPRLQEEVYGATTVFQQEEQDNPMSVETYAHLLRRRTGETIAVTSPEFVLGKDPSQTDYCIEGNSAISRSHAAILCTLGKYAVADRNATNGTYVNGSKLAPFQKAAIQEGDILRLADEEFEFHIAPEKVGRGL